MGRYYEGDIEGKFAFGVQTSTAADRFGIVGQEPPLTHLDYYFDEDNLDVLETELKKIEKLFGDYITPIMTYLDLFGLGNASIGIEEYLLKGGLKTMSDTQWSEYYDYLLGKKILECIKTNGECSFSAEL